MTTEKQTQANVMETDQSSYAVTIDVSGHTLIGDEPESAGGKNLGPAPYDLLLAALGECTCMTIRWYAKQKDWPLQRVEVALTHEKQKRDGQPTKVDVFTKKIKIYGPELSAEQRVKLLEVAAKCPIQRTLESTPQIGSEHAA